MPILKPNKFVIHFRIQQHAKTRELQISTWSDLILKYHRHIKQGILSLNDDSTLFCNESINRKLPYDGRLLILGELAKSGNASPLDKKRMQWEIYWHPLDEWAEIIYKWATDMGMTNTVCTIFELINGDNTTGEEFHGLDEQILIKALRTLETKGKCELIMFDDNQGVKFF